MADRFKATRGGRPREIRFAARRLGRRGAAGFAQRRGVTVDGAKVTATDIVADNGVIHVIDKVVLPK